MIFLLFSCGNKKTEEPETVTIDVIVTDSIRSVDPLSGDTVSSSELMDFMNSDRKYPVDTRIEASDFAITIHNYQVNDALRELIFTSNDTLELHEWLGSNLGGKKLHSKQKVKERVNLNSNILSMILLRNNTMSEK